MDTWGLVLAALLKIVFILTVVVGAFAPALVWAERRQSAMIQDRLGPRRAHIPLPKAMVGFMTWSLKPLRMGVVSSFAAAGLCIATLVAFGVFNLETVVGQEPEMFYWGLLAFGVLGGALALGHKVHRGIVENDGKLVLLGLLHPAADALKMIWKEDFVPPRADRFLFSLAPIITVVPAIASFAVIPFAADLQWDHLSHLIYQGVAWEAVDNAPTLSGDAWAAWVNGGGAATQIPLAGPTIPMQVASLNVGILFIFAVAGTGVIGAAIGGYASDNKFSLLGGIRAASQMVSYEVALGLTIVPCFMIYDSLRLEDIALWQHQQGWWGVFIPPLTLASILYSFAAVAETKRIPFDVPEGESELVGGYLTEYSGMKFGMFFTGEFVEVAVLAALAAVLFFGGWDVPFLYEYGFDLPGVWELRVPLTDWVIGDVFLIEHWAVILVQVVFFLFKIVVLIWVQLMIRWTLPRFRYDQIMALCWKGLLPLSLVNILFTGILILLWN
ncbi:MAG: complex I subunit 1 family protein [Myxococcota bacterium]